METRALIAFALSVAIVFGYQFLFPAPQPGTTPGSGTAGTVGTVGTVQSDLAAQPAAGGPGAVPSPVANAGAAGDPADAAATNPAGANTPQPAATPPAEEKRVEVATDLFVAEISSLGGRLTSFTLNKFGIDGSDHTERLSMVNTPRLHPLGVSWRDATGTLRDDRALPYSITGGGSPVSGEQTAEVVLRGAAADGTVITKTLTFHGSSYLTDFSVNVTGPGVGPLGVSWTRMVDPDSGGMYVVEGPAGVIDGDLESVAASSLEEPEVFSGKTAWGGYADHYFLAAYVAPEERTLRLAATVEGEIGRSTLWDDAAGGRVEYRLFVGPKRIHLLEEIGHDLSGAVDLGFFSFVARPLLEVLIFLHRFTGNYGWAILLLTFLIRVAFYPVNNKQMQAMKAMQKLQPEIKKIQAKFEDDRERLNKEMMELYRRHKVNPLSGCLPMLVQLPVFVGLYNVLMQAIELRHAGFLLWITDLSQPDRLGSLPIPFVEPAGIPVLTLLMGGSMFLQQKLTPNTGDAQQQKVMMLLPLIFTVMFVNFASGLVLYWLTNNVLSIAQQYLANRRTA